MRKKKATKAVPRSDTSLKQKRAARRKKVAVLNPRVERTRNAGTMTESQFWQMIRSAFRRKTMTSWKPVAIVRDASRVPYVGPNKRRRYSYICNRCHLPFPGNKISVHHIVECGTLSSASDLPLFVERLFCEAEGLEVLCDNCHDTEHKSSHSK